MRRIPDTSLWLGHVGDARNLAALAEGGIEAVVDLAGDESPAALPRDLAYCRFPLVDGPGNPPGSCGLRWGAWPACSAPRRRPWYTAAPA